MRLITFKTILNSRVNQGFFIVKVLKQKLFNIIFKNNVLEFYTFPFDITSVLYFLKNNLYTSYNILVDIIAIDFPKKFFRFKIIYSLLSTQTGLRLNLNIFVMETAMVNTVKKLFKSAPWMEREVWDLFGVFFFNNLDLRRILTDYGFRGFPFRKDFPLTGYIELRYDDSKGDIVYEPVELAQELRFFNFSTGWEKD